MGPRPALSRRALLLGAGGLAACSKPELQDWLEGVDGGFGDELHERGHRLRETRGVADAPGVTRRTSVLIAGGGIAGLAAARALRLRGIDDFVLLELGDEPGGNSRGTQLGGMACPTGAHYLPVPGDDAREVQDFLEECGLRRRVAGRWTYDERHLCHSPQERLFFDGRWQAGLLPLEGVGAATLASYRRFAAILDATRRTAPHALPASRAPFSAAHRALDAQTFAAWLDAQGLGDAHLRAYLDYCCRDDYGAGIDTVSAWAGLHYFASRHGFSAPGGPGEADGREAVLTWPEGNAHLVRQLARPLGERLQAGHMVHRIAPSRHEVQVDAWVHRAGEPPRPRRWTARHVIVALPVHVAARVIDPLPDRVRAAAQAVPHSAWVVSNLRLRGPLDEHGQHPIAWDNVIHGGASLGYVNAGHQRLDPTPAATVLTHYQALGIGAAARRQLMELPWTAWRDRIVTELAVAHRDLPRLLAQMRITRHGHAMACPVPGVVSRLRGEGWPGATQPGRARAPEHGRLSFAHADWAGYSVFEEAFTLGHLAGEQLSLRR